MEKVIITGADGFVGSYTVKHFLNNGKKVLALDMGAEARRLEEHPNLKYMQCDITDIKGMMERFLLESMTLLFILLGLDLLVQHVWIIISKCRMPSILSSV